MAKTFNECVTIMQSMIAHRPQEMQGMGLFFEFDFDGREVYGVLREGEVEWAFYTIAELDAFMKGFDFAFWRQVAPEKSV